MQFLDQVDDTSCCTTTGALGMTLQENSGSSAVAVLGQVLTCLLLRRQVHGGAVLEQGGKCPLLR